jgi:Methyl-accepting chemotaxis protein
MKNLRVAKKMIAMYINVGIGSLTLFIIGLHLMKKMNALTNGAGDESLATFTTVFIVLLVVCSILNFFIGRKIANQVAVPATILGEAMGKAVVGDMDSDVSYRSKDEMGILTEKFRLMMDSIHEQVQILEIISNGDYTVTIPVRSENDVMNKAITALLVNNNAMLKEINTTTGQVSSGSAQISSGAQALSRGATEQATAVEELSTTIAQVLKQTQENSENSSAAMNLVNQADGEIQDTVKYMAELNSAMAGIESASERISAIIKVIEDIAFQTNILALNAAVEAARAGQHGKGFAVVADEVRNLAGKSAEAAKETTELVQNCVDHVQRGSAMVDKTNQRVAQVASTASQAQEKILEINEASKSQKNAITQINESIEQITHVVQNNSAAAEENAAASEQLSGQSQILGQMVGRFKTKELEF